MITISSLLPLIVGTGLLLVLFLVYRLRLQKKSDELAKVHHEAEHSLRNELQALKLKPSVDQALNDQRETFMSELDEKQADIDALRKDNQVDRQNAAIALRAARHETAAAKLAIVKRDEKLEHEASLLQQMIDTNNTNAVLIGDLREANSRLERANREWNESYKKANGHRNQLMVNVTRLEKKIEQEADKYSRLKSKQPGQSKNATGVRT